MTTTRGEVQHVIRSFVDHEHHELLGGLDRIHDLACQFATLPATEASAGVLAIMRWLDGTLRPHMAWEESWLYPQIDERAGTPWATRLVRFDHQQIAQRAQRLHDDHRRLQERHGHALSAETRCDLFALEALMRAHVEREERFLLPLLDGDDRWPASPG